MKSWLKFVQPSLLAVAVAVVFVACDEQLDSGAACPALCPQPAAVLNDTTFFAVDLDTSIAGYPTQGSEPQFFIASMGDTLQTRAIVRFDSLPQVFRHINSATDSSIYAVDTGAVVQFHVVSIDTTGAPTTLDVYDVDMYGAEDSDPNAVTAAFTPDRLLGSKTFPAAKMIDSILSVPIDRDKLLAKIQTDTPANRLRIGVAVSGSGKSSISIYSREGGFAPVLQFRPSTDTTVSIVGQAPHSMTPTEDFVRASLTDYLVVAKSPPDPPADVLRVGSLPARRVYLRFNIPSHILDSSSVVRASLILTQRPNGFSPQSRDTVSLRPLLISASPTIVDVQKVLLFLNPISADSMKAVPADSGLRAFELISLIRAWRATTADKTPRAVALASLREGLSGSLVDFYSIEAPAAVRPRLRITYVPRQSSGLP